ncbi:phosphopantetheine-binding protein [Kitasatospora sp. NBC_01287]|uniref:type I polyketide synthase n=1 Tax=Kitasatospora sp. NBC_01287 TaxID=2903573 RepID=UPI00224ECEF8|nr:type I polyketide synthase [Kitasatospora sp. NBC_01287]MCX4748872.1 phosphopantetheine-binding protein [Kitasatospora sp. NBC_01287]
METDELRALLQEQHRMTRRLKARISELEEQRSAPLAVVATALRLPGGLTTPDSYWDFLLGEQDALSEIPEERPGLRAVFDERPDQLGRSYVRRAGFLSDIAGFDAGFFGISQREATALDPQQRLLLETGWEAMERAGLAVRRQDRLKAGVFVGMMTSEYVQRMAHPDDKTGIDPYFGTGGGHSMAAGRLSYVLGLSGPAISVDTACSSSLVALHLATRSLRQGECRYALVGGSNLILSPDLMVSLCQNKALAPDGRSKTFTAAADGYGRGEGVGMVLLMRLDEAEREGRPILAVLRGTAVNHDGASSGLTVPNGPAQQEVLRAALADAGVAAAEVGYVEAHGTGTSLGDPIEVGALDAVVGSGVADRQEPLLTGSVKSRIGHLEAAAGLAGLIKVVLMLERGRIPAALAADDGELNALIPWDRINIAVPRESRDWPAGYERRVAGLSAFGMSGTNAHVVLEAYQGAEAAQPAATGRLELVTLSAKHEESLAELVSLAAGHLGRTRAADLAAACHTLRAGRTPFEFRIAVTGRSGAELAGRLLAAAEHGVRELKPSRLTTTLRTRPGAAALGEAVAALAEAYPDLTVGHGRDEERLAEIVKQFGLKVRLTTAAADQRADAVLAWDGGEAPLTGATPQEAVALLPTALGALFTAGAELRLDALRPAGVRAAGDLPTYPFRRRRLWIEERATAAAAQGAAPAALAAVPGAEAADRAAVSAFLHESLRSLMHAEEDLAEGETFLELGGDSFIAMQLTLRIEETYEIEVPLDDFLEEITLGELFERLGEHILSGGVLIAAASERQSA